MESQFFKPPREREIGLKNQCVLNMFLKLLIILRLVFQTAWFAYGTKKHFPPFVCLVRLSFISDEQLSQVNDLVLTNRKQHVESFLL